MKTVRQKTSDRIRSRIAKMGDDSLINYHDFIILDISKYRMTKGSDAADHVIDDEETLLMIKDEMATRFMEDTK